jgi:hypothetical protein
MNCEQFRKCLREKLGELALDDREKAHLESCPGCAGYFRKLKALEQSLGGVSIEPIRQAEFVSVQDRLDTRIIRYLNRATGFYRLAVRYGTSLAAVVLLVFVSLLSGVRLPQEQDTGQQAAYSDYLYEYGIYEEIEVDDRYLGLAVDEYVRNHGLNGGNLYVGELSADEYDYLVSNIDVGGML